MIWPLACLWVVNERESVFSSSNTKHIATSYQLNQELAALSTEEEERKDKMIIEEVASVSHGIVLLVILLHCVHNVYSQSVINFWIIAKYQNRKTGGKCASKIASTI